MAKDRDSSRATEITQECTSFFLEEPVQWMKEASEDVEGKLNCPKCGARVGLLKWTGNQCSCEFLAALGAFVFSCANAFQSPVVLCCCLHLASLLSRLSFLMQAAPGLHRPFK